MRLYLLRHALTELNEQGLAPGISDVDLSQGGRAQANKLSQTLEANRYDAIYISPLRRTLQTLEPYLAKHPDLHPKVSQLMIERNTGELMGRPVGAWPQFAREHEVDVVNDAPPKGESISHVYHRAKMFFDDITAKHPDQSVLVCAHKISLMCLELAARGLPASAFYDETKVIPIENGELRTIQLD